MNKPKDTEDQYDEAAEHEWYRLKSDFIESILGEEHNILSHALIPFAIGGGLDLYYYPKGIPGTAIATKELVDRHGNGPSNRVYPVYELVMFTRHALNLKEAKDDKTPFGSAHRNINSILNHIARYCTQTTLNPKDTCEFPKEMKSVGGKCLILDGYSPTDSLGPNGMGLMLILEVFLSEMRFAMENSGAELIQMLKITGHYPYSDIDRQPVV
jgi:hypothetical protein